MELTAYFICFPMGNSRFLNQLEYLKIANNLGQGPGSLEGRGRCELR